MRTFAAVLLTLTLLPAAAFARGKAEEIRNPTIELETKASAAQVKKAVKLAVLARKWDISNESGGSFDATYRKPERRGGETMAKIRVSHSASKVTIKYLDSEGLSVDGDRIHPTYNKWVSNLERDIPIYVEREVTASE